jgi:hypothetical protein
MTPLALHWTDMGSAPPSGDGSLEGRWATATIGGVSRSIAVAQGCTQGGVLSPLLWYLVVDELLTRLNEGGIYAQGYADDICLLEVGKFPKTVSGLIQWALFFLWKGGAMSRV